MVTAPARCTVVRDLTEHGVGVEYQPGQLQFQVGDQHRAVLQVYGERFADPVVSVRDVIAALKRDVA